MYVHCSCGHKHWGLYGAAGLLLTDPARTGVVLQKRGAMTHHGGTWALPGGAIERGESAVEAALREAHEEERLDPGSVSVIRTFTGTVHPEWTYTYVLVEGPRPSDPVLSRGLTWESDGARWVDPGDAPALPLHPALRADWPWLVGELEAG